MRVKSKKKRVKKYKHRKLAHPNNNGSYNVPLYYIVRYKWVLSYQNVFSHSIIVLSHYDPVSLKTNPSKGRSVTVRFYIKKNNACEQLTFEASFFLSDEFWQIFSRFVKLKKKWKTVFKHDKYFIAAVYFFVKLYMFTKYYYP